MPVYAGNGSGLPRFTAQDKPGVNLEREAYDPAAVCGVHLPPNPGAPEGDANVVPDQVFAETLWSSMSVEDRQSVTECDVFRVLKVDRKGGKHAA
jgi:hypothetical protein